MFNRSSMAAVIAELDCIISFITASRTPNRRAGVSPSNRAVARMQIIR